MTIIKTVRLDREEAQQLDSGGYEVEEGWEPISISSVGPSPLLTLRQVAGVSVASRHGDTA